MGFQRKEQIFCCDVYCTIPVFASLRSARSVLLPASQQRCRPDPRIPGGQAGAVCFRAIRSQPHTPLACKAALTPQISAEKLPVRHALTVAPDLLEIFRKESSILLTEHLDCDAIIDNHGSTIVVYAFTVDPKYNGSLGDFRKEKYGKQKILRGISSNGLNSIVSCA